MIRVGPAGWSYADWEATVYPRPKPRGFHALAYLSRFVNTVEINASFYALPRREHAARWVELVQHAPAFRFTAKLHQDFTHSERPLGELAREVGEFQAGLEPLRLAGKLSALLAQFPIGFRCDPAGWRRLEELRDSFARVPLVLELRHRSWYEDAAVKRVGELGYSLAAIDLPAAANHPPPEHPTPGPIGYLRLHGRNAATWFAREAGRDQRYDYLYTPAEVASLGERARRLAGEHDQTFVITNNHFEGKALANALELLAALGGAPVPAPRKLVERYSQIAGVTRPDGPAELF